MPSDTPLAEIVAEEIRAAGPISFRRFMELALYDEARGYYASGRARVGRSGDFFTNVSVGPVFGRLLGIQFREMWERLGRPIPFTVVEQGANTGEFARDFLHWAERDDPEFARAAEYRIVEPFDAVAARQSATLAGTPRLFRHRSLSELPRFTGVHFSNELIDAFPVHLLRSDGSQWLERHVANSGDRFAFVDLPAANGLPLPEIRESGFETEIRPEAGAWIGALGGRLERGYVLAIDYGYTRDDFFAPHRVQGTLSAYRDHRRVEDPLERPGDTDLTAHVEFTGLVEEAVRAGFEIAGFTDQHHFMVGLGRLAFPDTDAQPSAELQKARRAFATLMHPGLMGMGFKALALAKGAPIQPLAGFEFARDPASALGISPG